MISDDTWKELQALFQMPDAARSEYENVIELYNRFEDAKSGRATPAVVRNELRKIAESARDLGARLSVISFDAIVRLTEDPIVNSQTPKHDVVRHLEARSNDALALAEWLDTIASATPDGQREAEDKVWFVRKIREIILFHTAVKISRSYKVNFVAYISAIGALCNPPIRAGSVDEAMKVVIRNSGDIGDVSGA